MTDIILSSKEKEELELRHSRGRDSIMCDRIKSVLLKSEGWSNSRIAQALRIDRNTVASHLNDYIFSKKLSKNSGGSDSKLSDDQTSELIAHLESSLYVKASDIIFYIKSEYDIDYTIFGIRDWLCRNGFSYKKPKGIPFKADIDKQVEFILDYDKLKRDLFQDSPLLFIDSVHPTQSTKLSYGWIRTGKDKAIDTNGSRTRINICGAINIKNMDVITKEYDKNINNEAIIDFLEKIKIKYSTSKEINIICDQAGYHKGNKIEKFLEENSKIKIHYLPTYSPNLNPIERLWKFMNEKIRNNRYFSSKKEFRSTILDFFQNSIHDLKDELKTRINDNFQIIGQ